MSYLSDNYRFLEILKTQSQLIKGSLPYFQEYHPEFVQIPSDYIVTLEEQIKHTEQIISAFLSALPEEGCPMESDTCVMDTSATLTDEKNKEIMRDSLAGLDDLL